MDLGQVVADRFEIDTRAGAGGMGVVYKAKDRATDGFVALKILRSADSLRFQREGEVLRGLTHPGIVKYIAAGRLPTGELYLAMEWLEGETLAQRFGRAGLDVRETLSLGIGISRALGFAHNRNVIHRDIKPSNIFLPNQDVAAAKLLDFGIARFHHVRSDITRTGIMIGTPGYMSPEQARGDRKIDPRADVFSLGCVLYKCLTGQNAYRGTDPIAVMAKILVEPAPRPSAAGVTLPEPLEDLIVRMLSKDPAMRPPNGNTVLAELVEIERAEGDQPSTTAGPVRASLLENEQRLVAVVMAAHVLPHESGQGDSAASVGEGTLRYRTVQPPLHGDPDSEELATREHPDGLHTRLSSAVSSHGGQLEALAEGSVVATIPATSSATDLALRAARCALTMRNVVPGAAMALATGRGTLSDRFPIGEVIDRAAALLRAGRLRPLPNGMLPVRVDEVSAGLFDARFELSGDAAGLLLCGERETVEVARTVLGRPTPCVGRERELGVVLGLFDEATAEPGGRVALITADAGVGKSRFAHEVLSRIKQREKTLQVWIGRGDPMSAGSPFSMIGPPLRRAAGILDNEPLVVKQKKLRARVGRHLAGQDLTRVAEFLGELCQVPFPDASSVQLRAARQDAVLMGDQMRRAWEDFLIAEIASGPMLFVLEDLHWGDLPSVQFFDAALRALHDKPFLLLALGRPEVDEIFPGIWQDRMIHAFRLGPLSKRGCEKLVRELLGSSVPDAIVGRLVERSAGNAFYLEELIRATADGKTESLPETVIAMVQSRLEGLPAEERRVLRAASVFGQTFSGLGVRALLGGAVPHEEVVSELQSLAKRELVTPREGRFQGDRGFQFRHALTREAAYAMLTDADKKLSHRMAAEWLAGTGESDGMVLAEHFERGGDPSSAAVWYRKAAEQALEANDLAAAVMRAERGVMCGARGELLGALRHVQAEAQNWRGQYAAGERAGLEALKLVPKGSAAWLALAGEVGVAQSRLGHQEGLAKLGEELVSLVLDAPGHGAEGREADPQPHRATAHGAEGREADPQPHRATAHGADPQSASLHAMACARVATRVMNAGQRTLGEKLLYVVAPAVSAAESGGATPESGQNPALRAWVHRARASYVAYLGDSGAHITHLQQSLEAFEKIGDVRRACAQRMNLGHGYLLVGAYPEAEGCLRDALTTAIRMGLLNVAAVARHNLGLVRAYEGALGEARALEAEAMKAFLAQGDRRQETMGHIYLATIRLFEGDLDGAEQAASAAVRMAGVPTQKCYALATLARVHLARLGRAPMGQRAGGEVDIRQALSAAGEAKALLDSLDGVEEGEALVRVAYAEALAQSGATKEAAAAISAAGERLRVRASWFANADLRESFLTRVPENARTLELAKLWGVG